MAEITEEIILNEPDTDEYKNYQKGQDVLLTVSTDGWKLVKEFIDTIVLQTEKQFHTSREPDPVKLMSQRDKATNYKDFAALIYSNIQEAIEVPDPQQ